MIHTAGLPPPALPGCAASAASTRRACGAMKIMASILPAGLRHSPPSSRQVPILPGKLAVRGLPGAKRRDATVKRRLTPICAQAEGPQYLMRKFPMKVILLSSGSQMADSCTPLFTVSTAPGASPLPEISAMC